jgi:predicted O-methyltransferase YrrM
MAQERWTQVDDYLAGALIPSDTVLDAAVRAGVDAGMPQIQVSPTQGRFLYLLVRVLGARKILELGTLAGFSTIWMARALPPGGHLITLEVDPNHAEVARSNFRLARLDSMIEVRVGAALESLPGLAAEGAGPFDLVFIDADKENIPDYVAWALRMSHPGTVMIVDNIVRQGAVIDTSSSDAKILGVRRMFELVASDPRLEATAIQTVGVKGYDGFAMIRVRG